MGDLGHRHEAGVPQAAQGNVARRPHSQPGDGAVVQVEARPGGRRKLQGPQDQVTDHIRVAHDEQVRVVLLLRTGPEEVAPKGGLDPRTIPLIGQVQAAGTPLGGGSPGYGVPSGSKVHRFIFRGSRFSCFRMIMAVSSARGIVEATTWSQDKPISRNLCPVRSACRRPSSVRWLPFGVLVYSPCLTRIMCRRAEDSSPFATFCSCGLSKSQWCRQAPLAKGSIARPLPPWTPPDNMEGSRPSNSRMAK